jgi:hypothetical protein
MNNDSNVFGLLDIQPKTSRSALISSSILSSDDSTLASNMVYIRSITGPTDRISNISDDYVLTDLNSLTSIAQHLHQKHLYLMILIHYNR